MYYATQKTCNLNCSYCYVPSADRSLAPFSDSVISRSLDKFIAKAEDENCIIGSFALHGSEPTLSSPQLIASIANRVCSHRIDNGWKGPNNIVVQTNGVLLNKPYQDALIDYLNDQQNLRLSFSIDGPRAIHNHYRNNSYQSCWNNLLLSLEQGFQSAILIVVTNETMLRLYEFTDWLDELSDLQKSFDNLYKIKFKFATGYSALSDNDYIEFADHLIRKDYFHLSQMLSAGYCVQLGNECSWLEPDILGNCYSCNKAYGTDGIFADWHSESFNDIFEKRDKLYRDNFTSPECSACPYEMFCNSGCPLDRYTAVHMKGRAQECLFLKRVFDWMISNGINISEYIHNNKSRSNNVFQWQT